jgi:hypothetical protein
MSFCQGSNGVREAIQRRPAYDRAECPVSECKKLGIHRGKGATGARPQDFQCRAAKHLNREVHRHKRHGRAGQRYCGRHRAGATCKIENGSAWVEPQQINQPDCKCGEVIRSSESVS